IFLQLSIGRSPRCVLLLLQILFSPGLFFRSQPIFKCLRLGILLGLSLGVGFIHLPLHFIGRGGWGLVLLVLLFLLSISLVLLALELGLLLVLFDLALRRDAYIQNLVDDIDRVLLELLLALGFLRF